MELVAPGAPKRSWTGVGAVAGAVVGVGAGAGVDKAALRYGDSETVRCFLLSQPKAHAQFAE